MSDNISLETLAFSAS